MSEPKELLKVLFLCTQNSARSQIAEAILTNRNTTRLFAASAGTQPASQVHPAAVAELKRLGIDWTAAKPKGVLELGTEPWDIVITVCDKARESCPSLPGRPLVIHWSIADPAAVSGDGAAIAKAFEDTARDLGRRIDLLISLPIAKLEEVAIEQSTGRSA